MDAHVFRRVSAILAQYLHKARLERIYQPVPSITAFTFFASGRKQCLFFRNHRSNPLLFFTDKSPFPNPAFPPASVMRLRKYAEGRLLGQARCNWVARQLAFALPGPENTSLWLLLDCKLGPCITRALPDDFEAEPLWPQAGDLPGLLADDSASWQDFPVLTPLLRRTLASLSPLDAAALLVDLKAGSGDLFWYAPPGGPKPVPQMVSAWPLPTDDTHGLREIVTSAAAETVLPMLAAMQSPVLLSEAKDIVDRPAQKQDKSVFKRRERLLAKLEEEKKRLEAMARLGDEARIIQANLWKLDPDARLESVALPLDPAEPDGAKRTIAMNSLMSVTENMQTMFRKAAKAARGLAMLDRRLALARETPAARPGSQPAPQGKAARGLPDAKATFPSSLIQVFMSSDGFALWRGRSAEGNRALLKLARPFDVWLHVEDGPSAHLLIRRDHAAQEIPDRTLREAAILVGLKSWRKNDPKATVMTALAKHVSPIKGAGPGTVRVQETLGTILVALDGDIEKNLTPAGHTGGMP